MNQQTRAKAAHAYFHTHFVQSFPLVSLFKNEKSGDKKEEKCWQIEGKRTHSHWHNLTEDVVADD
jgi:hypothetical protein